MTDASIYNSGVTTPDALLHANVEPDEVKIAAHDPDMMLRFLQALDPDAGRYTIQLFRDPKSRKHEPLPPGLTGLVHHLTREEIVAFAKKWNTVEHGFGMYVTVNETDFRGRSAENIVRVRALIGDADKNPLETFQKLKGKPVPSIIVQSSEGRRQIYFGCSDMPLDQFKLAQRAFNELYGTDPAVNDLPRVMRIPGTLHLKNVPQLVELKRAGGEVYSFDELRDGLGLRERMKASVAPRHGVTFLDSPEGRARSAELQAKLGEAGEVAMAAALAAVEGAGGWFDKLGGNEKDECLRAMLAAVPHIADGDRGLWLDVLMAIHASGAPSAYEIARVWSAQSDKFDPAGFDRDWGSFKNRPGGIGIGTLIKLATDHGWDSGSWKAKADGVSKGVAVGIGATVGSGSAILSIPRPSPIDTTSPLRHRPFLYGARLLRGEITVLAAPGGRGKSATAIGIALALAAGRKLMHDVVWGDAKTVLLLSTEDGREELHRRVLAAKQHYKLTDGEVARLQVAGADEGRFTLTTGSDKAAVVNQAAIDELGILVAELGADVLVLDPLGPLVPVGINDNGVMAQLVLALKRMASKLDCSVLLLHHFKKGADGSAESVSGASALVNHARVAVTIEGMKMDEGGRFGVLPSDLWRFFRLIDAKSNFAPPSNGADWLKLETVLLDNAAPPTFPNGDAVQVVAPMTFAAITRRGYLDPAERAIVVGDIITSVGNALDPPYVKAGGGARGKVTIDALIVTSISRLANRPTSDAQVIAAALFEELLREGVLAVEQVKTAQRKKRDGVILGPKAKADG
jgi:hypothetical protein